MTTLQPAGLSEFGTVLCIAFIFFVPFAIAGLALINTGLGRSHSATHSMLSSICVVAIAALVYSICGFAWQGYFGRPAHVVMLAGKPWNWIAAEPLFLRGLKSDASAASATAWLQMLGVGLAALIPLGTGAGRWRLSAICASTAMLAGFTYPLFGHWMWGGGWLAQLGMNYRLGRGIVDAGGSGSIHAVGGLTALSIAWILGPRRNKYSRDGVPNAIPGHNAVLVLLGCVFALVGWLGLNSAGAILFAGIAPAETIVVAVNTLLAASVAALSALMITRLRYAKPDASLVANGWVSGLVASSAGCSSLTPAASLFTGLVAGLLVTLSIEFFEVRLGLDDPGGAISVHAVGGFWGLLAVGFFAHSPAAAGGQWLAQVVGIATLLGFVLPLTYGLNWLLGRLLPQRASSDGDRLGMDMYELGGTAYPEFVTHTEEFFLH
jgi:Amt family ammonium transporter